MEWESIAEPVIRWKTTAELEAWKLANPNDIRGYYIRAVEPEEVKA